MPFKPYIYLFLIVLQLFSYTTYSQSYESFKYSIKKDDNTYLTSELLVDHNGFTWYATKDWVVKDFGTSKVYIPLKGLKGKPITVHAFLQDNDGNIWVVTPFGVYTINYNDYRVTNITKGSTSFEMYISIIQQKKNGHIWVSTNQNRFLEFKGHTLINNYKIDTAQENFFLLYLNKKDEVVMVSEYLVYSIKNNQLQFITTKTPEEILIPLSTPNKNSVNKTGVIHYGNKEIPYTYFTEIGMYKVYNKEWNTNKLLNDRRVDLTWVIKNNILSTTHKDLIWSQQFQFKNKQWYLNDVSKTNIHANIHSILQDSLNNYIVSSNPNQIRKIRIDNNFYTTHLVDSVNPISTRSIISDAKKNIFVASYSGLFKIDSLDITHNISNESNYAFLQKNDSLTWSNDIYLLTKNNFSKNDVQYFNQKNWPTINSNIRSLAYKNENQIWIGSLNGLHLFDEKTERFTNYSKLNKAHDLSDTYINDILQLPDNKVWLATNNGAYLYNSKTKTVIHYSSNSKTHKIPHTKVLDIHKDRHNTIWLAGDKGLVSINTNGVTNQYLTKDGLANNIVCSMLETKNHLWLGTYDGISRVNLTGNEKQFSNYLKGHEFNHSSSYKLNDSILFFGSMNGVYKILTNKVPKRSIYQKLIPVSLTTFQKEKDSIIEQFNVKNLTKIKLDHDTNYFEFKFALDKSFNHTKNNFLYKIEGLTKAWIPLNNTTTIRQYGIPPGNYVLKVKGINEEGMQAVNEISLPIYVSQIFYKTTWFILSCIGLILITTLIIILRIKRRNAKENKLESNIKELKIKALTMQMNPHFIFNIINNIQSDLILKSPININDYIHAFSSLLRTTMNMTTATTISLKNEIDYLEAYIKLQEYRLDNSFVHKFEIINHVNHTDIDSIKIPCMLLQPMIENAILHGLEPKDSPNNLLKITFNIDEVLEISIEDNGVGRIKKNKTHHDDDESHAMGLMKTRVDLRNELKQNKMNFEIIDLVDGNTPLGTKVIFKIPYKN